MDREMRVEMLRGRVEAAAREVLANRRRAVGVLLRNAWTDAARAASLVVRRAKAAPAPAGAAPASGAGGSSGRGGKAAGVPEIETPPGNPNTPFEGRELTIGGAKFRVRGGVLQRVGPDVPVVDTGKPVREGEDELLLRRMELAGVNVGAFWRGYRHSFRSRVRRLRK